MSEPSRAQPTVSAGMSAARDQLMEQHRAACQRREGAPLGSDEFRAAAEEVARIEIAIAQLEEPDPGDER
jgi:hypothetical protein